MIYIGSDHGGFELKEKIKEYLSAKEIEYVDIGVHLAESVDYPDIAKELVSHIDSNSLGILICGTGIGISISANRFKGIRCALCLNEYSAKMARNHNDANVLALGGRVVGENLAYSIVETFLKEDFHSGRHLRRIEKIERNIYE